MDDSVTELLIGGWDFKFDADTVYELKLLLIFSVLLAVLIVANVIVWRVHGDTLSAIYTSPELFAIEGDAALISHVTVGVEYKVASAQAAADADADSHVEGPQNPRFIETELRNSVDTPSHRDRSPPPSSLGRDKYFQAVNYANRDDLSHASRKRSMDASTAVTPQSPGPSVSKMDIEGNEDKNQDLQHQRRSSLFVVPGAPGDGSREANRALSDFVPTLGPPPYQSQVAEEIEGGTLALGKTFAASSPECTPGTGTASTMVPGLRLRRPV